jgi:hypothetical protein
MERRRGCEWAGRSRVPAAEGSMCAGGIERIGADHERREAGRGGGNEVPQRWRPWTDGAGRASLREEPDQSGMDVQSPEGHWTDRA